MTVIYGRNTAFERLENENMKPNRYVEIGHDWYTMHPEEIAYKKKEAQSYIDDDGGMAAGYKYDQPKKRAKDQTSQDWARHAIGGTAKVRRGYKKPF